MGNDYSRMQGSQFPPGYFCIGFRQPDILQVLHAGLDIIGMVKQTVQLKWSGGIKSEKRYSLGVELKLAHDPFCSDCNNMDRVINCYRFLCTLLEELINHGHQMITKGHFIKGIERNLWIFYDPRQTWTTQNNQGSCVNDGPPSSIGAHSVASIALEDWSKVLLVNLSVDVFSAVQTEIENLWSLGIAKSNFCTDHGSLELGGQPWDSYKPESDKTPLILIKVVEVMASKGYQLLVSSHIRGIIDTLFFKRNTLVKIPRQIIAMSLNQQDQLRFYNAPSTVVQKLGPLIRETWEKGVIGDEVTGPMWMLRLKGSPWWVAEWDKDTSMNARQLVTMILAEMRSLGWSVMACVELYRSQYDKSVFLFVPDDSASTLPHLCVSSHDVDRLFVAGTPPEIHAVLKREVPAHWSHGIKEDSSSSSDYLEFALEQQPWLRDPENCAVNLEGVGLICWLIEILSTQSWELCAGGADISSSTKYLPHTWFFSLKPNDTNSITFTK